MNNIKTYKEFKQIFENDNLDRSIKGMDKFGIKDDELPIDLQNMLKSKGWKYCEDDKSYYETKMDEHTALIFRDDEGDNPKNVVIDISGMNDVRISRKLNDLDEIKIAIEKVKEIAQMLVDIYHESEEDTDSQKRDSIRAALIGEFDIKQEVQIEAY